MWRSLMVEHGQCVLGEELLEWLTGFRGAENRNLFPLRLLITDASLKQCRPNRRRCKVLDKFCVFEVHLRNTEDICCILKHESDGICFSFACCCQKILPICVCVCRVCACVWERDRERGREREVCVCVCVCPTRKDYLFLWTDKQLIPTKTQPCVCKCWTLQRRKNQEILQTMRQFSFMCFTTFSEIRNKLGEISNESGRFEEKLPVEVRTTELTSEITSAQIRTMHAQQPGMNDGNTRK